MHAFVHSNQPHSKETKLHGFTQTLNKRRTQGAFKMVKK
jgi:hypothetical protein